MKFSRIAFFTLSFIISSHLSGQSPIGSWMSYDDKTGDEESIIEVFMQDGKLFGKIEKLMQDEQDTPCKKCPGDLKGQKLVGMVIIEGLEYEDGKWKNGTILDPENGKEYKCQIEQPSNDELKVRGYLGNPAFGRTLIWQRI